MLRHDFIDGGFPLCRQAPALIWSGLDAPEVVYNRFDLRRVATKYKLPDQQAVIHCYGFWPGKKTSDCFVLSAVEYAKYAPPAEHKEIDSASSIQVTLNSDASFESLVYVPGAAADDETPILSRDQELFEYIRSAGIKYSSTIE